VTGGMPAVIARGLAYAPYADLIWVETGTPDLDFARDYAEALHREFPDKLLALQLLAVVQLEGRAG
jgi:isocitrate lyase